MTKEDDRNSDTDVTYRTVNLFSSDKCFIYFISDVPDSMFILWNHIFDIFYEDRESGLHILPELSYDHIKLTPYSKRNVRLAAQVISSTVNKVLLAYGLPGAAETAHFCSFMEQTKYLVS